MLKVNDGLFIGQKDIIAIKEKIKNYPWAKKAADRLEKDGLKRFSDEFLPLEYSWYTPYKNLAESINVESYRNFNGKLYYGMTKNLSRAFILCCNIILLDKTEYTEAVKHTVLYYAENYPLHYFIMVDSGLVLSLRLFEYLFIIDAMKQYFSEEELAEIYRFTDGIAEDILKNHEDWKTCPATMSQHCNNHNVWVCAVLMAYGLYTDKENLVDFALNDSEGLFVYLEDAVIDNGLGIESSLGYNMFAVAAFIKAAEAARRSNYKTDLYTYRNSRGISVDDILIEIFQLASPDLSIPQLGDCYGTRQKPHLSGIYENAYSVYGRAEYGWILENTDRTNIETLLVGKEIKKSGRPDSISKIYKDHGFISVKSKDGKEYWHSDCFHLAAGYGYNGIHSNADQLAITLFGNGKVLIHDHETISTGRHAFSSDVQMELNRSRLSHSTVLADGRESSAIPYPKVLSGNLFREGKNVIAIMEDTGMLYNGIAQKRILCVNENYIADVFILKSGEEHTYDWILHAYDYDAPHKSERKDELLSGYFVNMSDRCRKWIFNPVLSRQDDDLRINWNIDGVIFSMFMKGEPGTEVLRFSLPERDDLRGMMSSSVAVRRKGCNAVFACVYSTNGISYKVTEAAEHEGKVKIAITYNTEKEYMEI